MTNFGNKLAESLSRFGDSEGIKESVMSIIQDRSLEYQKVLNDGFKTGVEGTKDNWAKDSGYFVALKMKKSIGTSITDKAQSNSKYSAADIKAAMAMEVEYSLKDKTFRGSSDEFIGVYVGMTGIKNELALSPGGVTENGRALLNNAFAQYTDEVIETHNEQMDFLRDDEYSDKSKLYSRVN